MFYHSIYRWYMPSIPQVSSLLFTPAMMFGAYRHGRSARSPPTVQIPVAT